MMLPISIDNRQRLGFAMMIRVLGLATTVAVVIVDASCVHLLLLAVIGNVGREGFDAFGHGTWVNFIFDLFKCTPSSPTIP